MFPRGTLADAGSTNHRHDLPVFEVEISKLVLKHGGDRGDPSRELTSLAAIIDFVAKSDDAGQFEELEQLIEPLAVSLLSTNPRIRRQAALALEYVTRKLGSQAGSAIDPLVSLVKREVMSPNQEASVFAMKAIGFIGPEAEHAIPLLCERLSNAETPQCFTAAEALGRIAKRPEAAVPALIQALEPGTESGRTILGRSEQEMLYEYVAIAFGCFGSDATTAAPRLVELLQFRQNPHLQRATVQALCRIGSHSEQAIPALVTVVARATTASIEAR